jgi:hypothetical protein
MSYSIFLVDIPCISIKAPESFCEGDWWDCGTEVTVGKQRNKGRSCSCLGCLEADSKVQNPNQDRPHEYSAILLSLLTTLSEIPLMRDEG